MTQELPISATTNLDRADAITRAQIDLALQLNAKYFAGEGLDHFGSILQALAQNYHAHLLNAKAVK